MSAKNTDNFEMPDSDVLSTEPSEENLEGKVRNIRPQFASEPEPEVDNAALNKADELHDEQPTVENAKPNARKVRKAKKGNSSFRKLTFSVLTVSVIGAGCFGAYKVGLLDQLSGAFANNDNVGQIEQIQTQHSQLLMRLNSLENRYNNAEVSDSLEKLRASNKLLESEILELKNAQSSLESEHQNKLAQVVKTYDQKLQTFSAKMGEFSGDLSKNNDDVRALKGQVSSISSRVKDTEQNHSRLIRRVNDQTRAEPVSPAKTITTSKVQDAQPKIKKTVVNEWAGLRLESVFSWGDKKIALLSDGLGGTFQMPVGELLGNYKTSYVGDDYVEFLKVDGSEVITLEKS